MRRLTALKTNHVCVTFPPQQVISVLAYMFFLLDQAERETAHILFHFILFAIPTHPGSFWYHSISCQYISLCSLRLFQVMPQQIMKLYFAKTKTQ